MIQIIKDIILEIRIQIVLNRLLRETNYYRQRDQAAWMSSLIRQRSEKQVSRMERKMGLL